MDDFWTSFQEVIKEFCSALDSKWQKYVIRQMDKLSQGDVDFVDLRLAPLT